MNNSKKAELRHANIRDMLQKADVINIQEFCNVLHVSIATIRNDLTYLEKKGYLKRVLGGAISTEGTPRNTIYASRINLYRDEKQSIAKYVVSHFIKPNMQIILDAGTTNQFIAEYLLEVDIPCSIMTNAFNIISILSKSENIDVHCAGGKLDKEHNAFHDLDALCQIKKYHADIYFLSPNGVDLHAGITGSSESENMVKKEFIQIAKRLIVVADSSKFDKTANYTLTNLSTLDYVVSDTKLTKECKSKFEKAVNIVCV